jgi:tRNA A-37 threonylcarbamoyl transferase component Bud32
MSEDQWAQVETYFHNLLETAPGARAAVLDAIADETVRREVDSLLRHSDSAASIQSSIGAMAAGLEPSDSVHEHFGPWRLVRRLGQGGQGTVFEAVRDDGVFQQRVALKVVKREMDSDAARRRFRHERQILAALEHPHIGRLLDGGESNGSPWLAMEFVDGEPLTTATAGWSLKRQLKLFGKVVAAVAYAHRHLIVHRDLKPSNILVTRDGEPKLLDFGIGRLLEDDADAERERTATLAGMMTPDYASPEQVKGESAGVSSDIYSLGAILFRLLTGVGPHRLETYSTADVYRAICLDEIVPPSEAAPPELRRQLRGDLDTLVLTALAKDANDRYVSAEAFSSEIERYLEGRPLTVRPASAMAKAWKFVKRNRLAVGAASLVVTAIAAGTTVSLVQANLARQRFEQVRKLAHSFVFDYDEELAKVEGNTKVREKMVRTALEYLDNLSKSAGGNMELLEELATAYEKVGQAQGYPTLANLGHTDQAIASYRKAEQIYGRIMTRRPMYKEAGLFYWNFADLLRYAQKYEEAAGAAHSARRNFEQAAHNNPADPSIELNLARIWCVSSDIDQELARSSAAYEEAHRCDEMASRLWQRAPDGATLELAERGRNHVANTAEQTGRLSEALRASRETEELVGKLIESQPANPGYRRERAVLAQFQSTLYYDDAVPNFQEPARALAYAREYLEYARQMAAHDPNNASARFSLAVALFRLSFPLKHSDPAAAVARAQDAVREFDRLIAEGKESYLVRSRRARALRRLSEAWLFAGKPRESEAAAADALTEMRKVAAQAPRDTQEATLLAMTLVAAAQAADASGARARAAGFLEESEQIAAPLYGQNRGELMLLIPLVHVREARARHSGLAGDVAESRRWADAVQRLWREFPDQNEYVQRQRARAAAE